MTKAPHELNRVWGVFVQFKFVGAYSSCPINMILCRETTEPSKIRDELARLYTGQTKWCSGDAPAIGVGIGVLIAPASGDETRADIANKVSEFSDKVRERAGDATGTHGVE